MNAPAATRSFWTAFGPGLLFAGAAVGVSHLVQSTRAGAMFGLSMLLVVVIANVVKFPAFRFGPQYAAATGHSLLDGYRRQGRWTLVVFTLLTLATMFTITAVVTVVTAGVAIAVFGLEPLLAATVGAANGPAVVSAVLIALSAVLLAGGGYVWLDRFIKIVMPVLTVCTVAAMWFALGRIEWSWGALVPSPAVFDAAGIAFCVALIGWMPSAIDISVWSSLWTVARAKQQGVKPAARGVLLDFDVGYLATLLLGLVFVLLGTGMMYGQGLTFENNTTKFAAQVIDLYTSTLGGWAHPIIGTAAFLVMLSTSVTSSTPSRASSPRWLCSCASPSPRIPHHPMPPFHSRETVTSTASPSPFLEPAPSPSSSGACRASPRSSIWPPPCPSSPPPCFPFSTTAPSTRRKCHATSNPVRP